MAFDGSGNFNRVHNWGQDAAASINIESSRMDAEDNNFAAGLGAVLVRDGQAPMTGNLNFGSNKGTNLATPTADNDATNKAYVDTNFVGNQGGVLAGSDPFLGFQNTDEAANVQRWRIGMDTSAFTIEPLQSDGSAGVDFGAVSFSRDENGIVGATLPNIAVSNDTSNTLLSLFSDAMPQIMFDDGGVQGTVTFDGPNDKFAISKALDITGTIDATAQITTTGGGVKTPKTGIADNDGHGNASLTFNCFQGVAEVAGSAARLRADTDTASGGVFLQVQDSITQGGAWAPTTVFTASGTSFAIGVNTSVSGTLSATGNVTFDGELTVNGSGTSYVDGSLIVGTVGNHIRLNHTGDIEADNSITGVSLSTTTGNINGAASVFAGNGHLYARGAGASTGRYTYFQNAAGTTTYGYVGWNSTTNGIIINDSNHGRSYYTYGAAGSYRGHVFTGSSPVALSEGMRCRTGMNGTYQSNRINISWSSPDASLWIDGANQGPIFTTSDERYKDVIPGTVDALGIINQMTLKKFKWKNMPADEEGGFPGQVDDGKEYFGVMAQEVAELFPAAAYGNASDMIKKPTAWEEIEEEIEETDKDGKTKKVKIKRKGEPTAYADTDVPQKMGLYPLHLCNLLLGAVQQLTERLEALEGA